MPRSGNSTERGYGSQHQKLREAWRPSVEAGDVDCARCREPIWPGALWDLGHTDDRAGYTGPEHRRCNRRAGAIKRNTRRSNRARRASMDW